jgi:hypothetical protein
MPRFANRPRDQTKVSTCSGAAASATAWLRFVEAVRKSPEPLATNTTPAGGGAGGETAR